MDHEVDECERQNPDCSTCQAKRFGEDLHISKWNISEARLPSNIEWGNYFDETPAALVYLKAFIMNLLMALIFIFVATPIALLESFQNSQMLKDNNPENEEETMVQTFVKASVAPMLLTLVNYIIFP